MKKLTGKLFAIATVCTMLFVAAACGSDAQPDNNADITDVPSSSVNDNTDNNTMPSNDNKDTDNKDVDNNTDADKTDADNADTDSTDADDASDADNAVSELPSAITAVTKISVPDILYTGWNIISIEVDGVKVSDDDFYTMMEKEYDGYFDFVFNSETETMLGTRNNYYMGTYTAEGDNVLHVVFDDFAYYAAFTMMEGTETLVLVDTAAPEITLYLWQMDEK